MSSDDFKGRFSLEPTRSETPIAPGYRWYTIPIAGVQAGGKHCHLPSAFWRRGALVIYRVWTGSSGYSAQVRSYPLIADLPTNFLLSHIPSNCPPYLKCVFFPPLLVAENISLSDHFFFPIFCFCTVNLFHAFYCLFSFIISAVITSLLQGMPNRLSEGKNLRMEDNRLETNTWDYHYNNIILTHT